MISIDSDTVMDMMWETEWEIMGKTYDLIQKLKAEKRKTLLVSITEIDNLLGKRYDLMGTSNIIEKLEKLELKKK